MGTEASARPSAGALPRPGEAQRKANLRTAWILAALAATFGVGFFVRIVLFGA